MRTGPGHRRRRAPIVLFAAIGVVAAACTSASEYPRPSATLPPTTVVETPVSTTTRTSIPDTEIFVGLTDDLSELVEQASAGATFLLERGVHRQGSVRPKEGMTFTGEPGAVLSGAIVIEGFSGDGETWSVDGITLAPDAGGECIAGYASCGQPNDLFIDNIMVWRVDSEAEVESGTWWGGEGRIVLGDDPTSRVVEMSSESHAFVGAASDVTIEDLIVEKYATPSQQGAINAQEANDGALGERWTIENVEIRFNHAVGLRTGNATRVQNVFSHDNGQLGVAVSSGNDVLISDSEVSFNNVRGYLWEWEGGGGKFTRTSGLVVRRTFAHDNLGPGLWTDIDTVDTLYDGNTVKDNLGPGIFHEISGPAVIRDNEISGNGHGKSSWAWGAGILIAASFDVEVFGNNVHGNADGITGVQQERGEGPLGPRLLDRIYVHDNDVELSEGVTGVVQDVGDRAVFTDRTIRFESNRYTGVGNRRAYAWNNKYLTPEGWRGEGQDVDGTWN